MSTAVAVAPSSHNSPALGGSDSERRRISRSPKSYMATSSSTAGAAQHAPGPPPASSRAPAEPIGSRSPRDDRALAQAPETSAPRSSNPQRSSSSRSPLSHKRTSPGANVTSAPLLPVIKKERAASPEPHVETPASARHRPRRLDLSNSLATNKSINSARPSAPLTSKDALMDVGLACLSPGFQTQDPDRQQQLARSMDLREQQRQIIESRLHKTAKDGGPSHDSSARPHALAEAGPGLSSGQFPKTPGTSRRKGPPPGLAITAPSPQRFASERVIQSAPLNQTFTGLRQGHGHPLSRQVLDPQQNQHGPGPHTSSTQINHLPANQTANRLPPISDVFAREGLGSSGQPHSPNRTEPQRTTSGPNSALHPYDSTNSPRHSSNPNQQGAALPSPGLPPLPASGPAPAQQQQAALAPQTHRDREFRSAEEALHSLAGGREDLLPKHVHYNGNSGSSGANNAERHAHQQTYYGGHQPPTPPSPLPPGAVGQQQGVAPGNAQHQAYLTPQQSSSARRPPGQVPAPFNSGSRRRTREEFEQDLDRRDSAEAARRNAGGPGFGLFGGGRDSPETLRRKKERFLQIVEEAWELLHS